MTDSEVLSTAITEAVQAIRKRSSFPVTDTLINGMKADPKHEIQQLGQLLEILKKREEYSRKQFVILADMLELLRVCIQYMGFDLEATQRERDYKQGM